MILRNLRRSLWQSGLVRFIRAYGASGAGNYASGLAFNAFITMFPLTLGLLSILGLVIHDDATQRGVRDTIVLAFPSSARTEISGALEGVHRSAGLFGLISIAGLLVSGTSLFAAAEFALAHIFGTTQRDPIRQRLMGLAMLVVFLITIVVTVAANTIVTVLPAIPASGSIIGAAALTVLLVCIYRLVPVRTFRTRSILSGAAIAALCAEILTLAFPLYVHASSGFNSYGRQFALFFLIAAWLYLLSQALLMGAVFVRLRAGQPLVSGFLAGKHPRRHSTNESDAIDEIREGLPPSDAK